MTRIQTTSSKPEGRSPVSKGPGRIGIGQVNLYQPPTVQNDMKIESDTSRMRSTSYNLDISS